jgi:hypothetical protein
MRRRARGLAVGAGPAQGQFDGPAPILRGTLRRGQVAPERLGPFGFGLLKLDVFAFESSCHD